MLRRLMLSGTLCTALSFSSFAAGAILPVVTGTAGSRAYTTTVVAHNGGDASARCVFTYRAPDRAGKPLISRETVAAGETRIYDDFLSEVGAAGTVTVDCSEPVDLLARLQESTDGGRTFQRGRLFHPLPKQVAVKQAAPRTVRASSDLALAEIAGKPVHVDIRAANFAGAEYAHESYEVPPYALRIVKLAPVLAKLTATDVTITVTGEGALAVGNETREPALAEVALHRAPRMPVAHAASVSGNGSVIAMLGLSAFKAAPFVEPATGDIYMRDRWYDPKSGTFFTPDRAGYRDSPNLYSYGKGDPVNRSDPTGMTVALWGDRNQKNAAYKRLLGTVDNPAAAAYLRVDRYNRVTLVGITLADFFKRYDGRAQQLAQMIDSPKTVYLTEVRSSTPITNPFAGDDLLQDKIEGAGGGFFDKLDHAHGLAAFNPDLFPREVADVTETADATFVHEFYGHAYAWAVPYGATEAQTGTIPAKYVLNPFTGGIGAGEADGLWAENTYRLQHHMRLRTYYLRAVDDWNAPAWLVPAIERQHEDDAWRAATDAEKRRQLLLQHNIWNWPGLR